MEDSSSKKILVTGGAGYVGSHCVKALARAGYTPVVFDNFSTGHREFVRWGEVIEGDVRDADALVRALETTRASAVMHFAALSLVGQSVAQPDLYHEVNVGGTANLLAAMERTEVQALVFSSSAAVYGEPNMDLISEATKKAPSNPYGQTKLACEELIRDAENRFSLRSACLRYFNAAGADGEVGEHHDPETHLIPLLLDAALGRRSEFQLFGTDYPTDDGTAVRDYIHVSDLASAHLAALEYLMQGGKSQALNLGTGQGTSVRQVIDVARKITMENSGRAFQIREAPRRAGDPPRLVADPAQAKAVLHWKAERSDLETILTDAWAWHRSRF